MKASAVTILTHCIGWLLLLLLPIVFTAGQHEQISFATILLSPYYWVFLACYAILFYSHTYLVFPSWHQQKKYLLYALFILISLVLIMIISPFDKLVALGHDGPHEEFMRPPPPLDHPHPSGRPHDRPGQGHRGMPVDIVSLILYFLTIALSIAVITLKQLRKSKEEVLQAEAKKAQAELSYLKAQINPHFLFNTLNNIYVLASAHHENTAPAVLKLSNILRYVTDEVSEDFVPLDNEISCIRDYIDLQKMRMGTKTSVVFEANGNMAAHKIPPMILMTFIENAFKFGISTHETSEIIIKINASPSEINFFCRNAVFHPATKPERTGIGLVNTKQRLDYFYRDNYELHSGSGDGLYTVSLRIKQ